MAIRLSAPNITGLLPSPKVAIPDPPKNQTGLTFVSSALKAADAFVREMNDVKDTQAVINNYADYYEGKGEHGVAELLRSQGEVLKPDVSGRYDGIDTSAVKTKMLNGILSFAQQDDKINVAKIRAQVSSGNNKALTGLVSNLNTARRLQQEFKASEDANERQQKLLSQKSVAGGGIPLKKYQRKPNPYDVVVQQAETAYNGALAQYGGQGIIEAGGTPARLDIGTPDPGYTGVSAISPNQVANIEPDLPSNQSSAPPSNGIIPDYNMGGANPRTGEDLGISAPIIPAPLSPYIARPAEDTITPLLSGTPPIKSSPAMIDPNDPNYDPGDVAAYNAKQAEIKQTQVATVDSALNTVETIKRVTENDKGITPAAIKEISDYMEQTKRKIAEVPNPEGTVGKATIKRLTDAAEQYASERSKASGTKEYKPLGVYTNGVETAEVFSSEGKVYQKYPNGEFVEVPGANPLLQFSQAGWKKIDSSTESPSDVIKRLTK